MDTRPSIRITLREQGAGPPLPVRLRGFLKVALRRFGLRCIAVEEVPATPPLSRRRQPVH